MQTITKPTIEKIIIAAVFLLVGILGVIGAFYVNSYFAHRQAVISFPTQDPNKPWPTSDVAVACKVLGGTHLQFTALPTGCTFNGVTTGCYTLLCIK